MSRRNPKGDSGKPKNIHEGHRKRIRKKMLSVNKDLLEDHELIEILLFYTNKIRNTNDIAHYLINGFGNIKEVINASYDELKMLKDVGGQTALFINFVRDICREYEAARYISDKVDFGFLSRYFERCTSDFVIFGVAVNSMVKFNVNSDFSSCLRDRKALKELLKVFIKNDCDKAVIVFRAEKKNSFNKMDLKNAQFFIKKFADAGIHIYDYIMYTGKRAISMRKNTVIDFFD